MERKKFFMVIFSILFLVVVSLFAHKNGFFDFFSEPENFNNIQKADTEENIIDNNTLTTVADQLELSVQNASYSKTLQKVPMNSFFYNEVKVDGDKTLQSKHSYLYINVEIKNNGTETKEISLNNIKINCFDKTENPMNEYELWSMDYNSEKSNDREYFHCSLNSGETKKINLVYVLEDVAFDNNYQLVLEFNPYGVGAIMSSNSKENTVKKGNITITKIVKKMGD